VEEAEKLGQEGWTKYDQIAIFSIENSFYKSYEFPYNGEFL
jgi:hypothetical protein